MTKNTEIQEHVENVILNQQFAKTSSPMELLKLLTKNKSDISKIKSRDKNGQPIEQEIVGKYSLEDFITRGVQVAPCSENGNQYFFAIIKIKLTGGWHQKSLYRDFPDALFCHEEGSTFTVVYLCTGGQEAFDTLKNLKSENVFEGSVSFRKYISVRGGKYYVTKIPEALGQFKLAASLGYNDWLKPLTFKPKNKLITPLSNEFMPSILWHYVNSINSGGNKTLDYTFASVVCLLGIIISQKLRVAVDESQYTGIVPLIWTVLVGEPGVGKTPAITTALKHFEQFVLEFDSAHTSKMREQVEKIVDQLKSREISKTLKEHAENNQAVELGDIEAAIKNKYIVEDKRISVEKDGVYLVTDTTLAGLNKVMLAGERPVLLHIDELKGLLSDLESTNNAGLRSLLLQAEAGNNQLAIARGNKDVAKIENASLAVLAGIQPDAFSPYIRSAASGDSSNDGLINRFQVIVFNVSAVQKHFDLQFGRVNQKIFSRMLKNLRSEDFGFDNQSNILGRKIYLSEQAYNGYQDWLEANNNRLVEHKDCKLMKNQLNKYQALICKISLIYQVVMSYDADEGYFTKFNQISIEAFNYASKTVDYLYSHAKAAFIDGTNINHDLASELLHRLIESGTKEFTASQIAQRDWKNFKRQTDLITQLLKYVESFGLVKSEETKKTTKWKLFPNISDVGI